MKKENSSTVRGVIGALGRWVLIGTLTGTLLAGCDNSSVIRIGFSGELTGRHADLGVQGRNGVQLAVEDINEAGGVAGRTIELLVRDDKGIPEGARAADGELCNAGVVAIIGHMTSGQSIAALPVMEEERVVLLSPTTSTSELSGLDDYFLRINPVNSLEAHNLARHIYYERGLTSLAVIYDTDNIAYTGSFVDAFAEVYNGEGGQIIHRALFSSASEPDFRPMVQEMLTAGPEALLMVSSALDTALISQQTRLAGWQVPLFASGWSQTGVLLQNGGQAIEGMESIMNYDPNNPSPSFLDFQERYQERFGKEPTFAATQSYEAMLILAAALEKTGGSREGLRETLLQTRNFEGLTGRISLDKYGDVLRTQFLLTVRDGQFVTLTNVEPVEPVPGD